MNRYEKSLLTKIVDKIKSNTKVKKVILFGSRAKGCAKNGSDIDIAIIGDEINLKEILKISTNIDELNLPYKVDMISYGHIKNKNLKKHIDRVGIEL